MHKTNLISHSSRVVKRVKDPLNVLGNKNKFKHLSNRSKFLNHPNTQRDFTQINAVMIINIKFLLISEFYVLILFLTYPVRYLRKTTRKQKMLLPPLWKKITIKPEKFTFNNGCERFLLFSPRRPKTNNQRLFTRMEAVAVIQPIKYRLKNRSQIADFAFSIFLSPFFLSPFSLLEFGRRIARLPIIKTFS